MKKAVTAPRGLQPFFSYYGGKWRAAPHYPAPEYGTIIEPFAGAAGYSLRYPDRQVILVERDPGIAALWRWLITEATTAEVLALPDMQEEQTVDDLGVRSEAATLIGFWINKGSAVPKRRMSHNMRRSIRGEVPRDPPSGWWGPAIRARIAQQLAAIRHWEVIEGDYTAAPDLEDATDFVDPPYQTQGKYYRFGAAGIDFDALGAWCRGRRGQTIVCEQEGANWLPFQFHRDIKASEGAHGGKRSCEVIWTNRPSTGAP